MKTPRAPKTVRDAERAWAAALVRSYTVHPIAVQSFCITAGYLTEKKHEASHRRRARAILDAWNRYIAALDPSVPHTPEPSR